MVNWTDNSNNETGFRIVREIQAGPNSWFASGGATVTANVTAYSETPPNATYRYKVRAYNNRGASSYTAPVVAVVSRLGSPPPPPPPPPVDGPPTNLQVADQGNGTVMVSWADNSAHEDHYIIERNPGQPNGYQVTAPDVTSVIDTTPPGTYAYRVYAMTAGVVSAATPWTSITVGSGGSLAAPTNLQLMDMGNGSVQVSWNDNSSNEEHFVVERSPNRPDGYFVTAPNATSLIDQGAGSGTFSYRV